MTYQELYAYAQLLFSCSSEELGYDPQSDSFCHWLGFSVSAHSLEDLSREGFLSLSPLIARALHDYRQTLGKGECEVRRWRFGSYEKWKSWKKRSWVNLIARSEYNADTNRVEIVEIWIDEQAAHAIQI